MTARATKTPKARDDEALKQAVAKAALTHIPFDGFTDKTLSAAAAASATRVRFIGKSPFQVLRDNESGSPS